jgi:small lipoprotein (TIGR04454 family)
MNQLKLFFVIASAILVFNCGPKQVVSDAECRPPIEKVISEMEASATDEQKAAFIAMKDATIEKLVDQCKKGKVDLECIKNGKEFSALAACMK